jgi:hypothetical protein
VSRRAWTKPCCSVLSTPDRRGRCSGVRSSPPLHTTRGGGRRPAARDRATRTCARTTTPHPFETSTFGWWPRAAAGVTDARSSRAASSNPRHGRRSCSAAAVLCGRLRFAVASDPRNQHNTRCEPRHARTTLRASLHTQHHTTLAKRPAALAKRPIALAERPTAPAIARAPRLASTARRVTEARRGVPSNRALHRGWRHRPIHRSSHGPAQSVAGYTKPGTQCPVCRKDHCCGRCITTPEETSEHGNTHTCRVTTSSSTPGSLVTHRPSRTVAVGLLWSQNK